MNIDLRFLDLIAAAPAAPVPVPRYHVVLLNSRLRSRLLLTPLLTHATTVSCADGGYCRLLARYEGWEDELRTALKGKESLMVVGDLDSAGARRDEAMAGEAATAPSTADGTRGRRCSFGFEFIQLVDNYTTDFMKTLRTLIPRHVRKHDAIIVDGVFGGRFDQCMGNMHVLLVMRASGQLGPTNHLVVIGEESLCVLIPPLGAEASRPVPAPTSGCGDGTAKETAETAAAAKETASAAAKETASAAADSVKLWLPNPKVISFVCGLIPIVPVNAISTKGLRWNVTDVPFDMVSICGSSNEIASRSPACGGYDRENGGGAPLVDGSAEVATFNPLLSHVRDTAIYAAATAALRSEADAEFTRLTQPLLWFSQLLPRYE